MESAPLKTWELSLYETKRRPQEAITDNTEIAVSPRALHSELMCPICLDILKNTMTTKECLHRFCQVCIITALRSGNKECPTCRKKLVSKRSLRHDPNFDQLIAKIYPSREEFEAHEERVLAKLSKFASTVTSCDASASGAGRPHGAKKRQHPSSSGQVGADSQQQQQQQRHQRPVNSDQDDDDDDDSSSNGSDDNRRGHQISSANNKRSRGAAGGSLIDDADSCPDHGSAPAANRGAASSSARAGCGASARAASAFSAGGSVAPSASTETDIELLLKPLPGWSAGKGVETKYLKTVCTATVAHLVSYLRLRHSLDRPEATSSVAAAAAAAAAAATAAAAAAGLDAASCCDATAAAATEAAAAEAAAAAAASSSSNSSGQAALSGPEYAIYCGGKGSAGGGGGHHRLPDQLTLAEIRDKYWTANKVLDLFFERLSG